MRIKDENKIERIFAASLRLIGKVGIAGITMAKIAKESGLATGTLYIYFKNKDILINEIYKALRTRTLKRFLIGVDNNDTTKKKIHKVWLNYLKNRVEHSDESIFLEQYYRSPFITKEHYNLSEQMKEPVKKIIRQGQAEGVIIQGIDEEMIFLAMLGFIRELADEHVAGTYQLDKNRIEQAFELNWKSIAT